MLSIGNVTTSNFIQTNLSKQIKQISEAGERLSSGKRINSAADEPSAITTISRLNAKISSISQAIINGGQAITLTQTAESGLSEINNLLSVIRSLAVEGLDTTLTDADRSTLQVEIDAYLAEIDAITKTTKFDEIILLDGSKSSGIGRPLISDEKLSFLVDRSTPGFCCPSGQSTGWRWFRESNWTR